MINNRDKDVLKVFGVHLRQLRKERNLSQWQLEVAAEISKNQVGNIERGEVNITLTTATAIAKALNIPLKDLFDY
ncbi:helix-turn-helix transcriptional regulator [Pedobacter sp. UBA4863]|uniref:helix-turn-helix domain-containing protein n=1 Tax=Pedobacter sp. UBA4863 TaxID=1947060 RepID=UPI0025D227E4|nr:helix-turn-helix transcriptional regulator [Pedobacter sp. UBA4863]